MELGLALVGLLVAAVWLRTMRWRSVRRECAQALEDLDAGNEIAARERKIVELFEQRTATLPYRGRIGLGLFRFVFRKDLNRIPLEHQELLRAGYLLFNRNRLTQERFDYIRFTILRGGDQSPPTEWTNVIGMTRDIHTYKSESSLRQALKEISRYASKYKYRWVAKDELIAVVNQLEAKKREQDLVDDLKQRLVYNPIFLSGLAVPATHFSGTGERYGLRLAYLSGHRNVELTYKGEGSLATIAPPGAGKTQVFVIPNMLHWPGPAVVLDVKGEIYDATAQWRAKNVGPVVRFSPLTPESSAHYNPLTLVRQDPQYLWEDSRFLADMMVVPSEGKDPFWEKMARDVVAAAIANVCYHNEPAKRTMAAVLDIVFGVGWTEFVSDLRSNFAVDAMRQAGESLAEIERKTLDGVLKTAQSSLSAWQGTRLKAVTSQSDWTPEEMRRKNGTVYLCINPGDIESYLSVLRVFIAQHVRAFTATLPPRDAAPVLLLLDEFPRLKKMPPIEEALNVGRQYGLRLWLFAQSYGQLKEAYPNAEGMLGSCAVRIFMNLPENDEMTGRLSQILGLAHLNLAGPEWQNLALIMSTNCRPAIAFKAFAWQNQELMARMKTAA